MLDTAKKEQIAHALSVAFQALQEKGYDPIEQLSCYMLSEDPHYITTFQNARGLMTEWNQDELSRFFVEHYFNK